MSERLTVKEAQLALDHAYEEAAVESHYDVDRYCDARNAYRNALLAARDAEWRAAVEWVREEYAAYREPFAPSTILDALLAAMEVPHDAQ